MSAATVRAVLLPPIDTERGFALGQPELPTHSRDLLQIPGDVPHRAHDHSADAQVSEGDTEERSEVGSARASVEIMAGAAAAIDFTHHAAEPEALTQGDAGRE